MIGLLRMAILDFLEGRARMKEGNEVIRGLDKPRHRRKKKYTWAGARVQKEKSRKDCDAEKDNAAGRWEHAQAIRRRACEEPWKGG